MENPVSEVNPAQAWEALASSQDSILVDVRTKAEWGFVGTADLSALGKTPILIEWMSQPGMQLNDSFAETLHQNLNGAAPSSIYFLCRSGARSMQAAYAIAGAFAAHGVAVNCINVAEGFEGDLDEQGHRGNKNGWKARNLAWRQS